jgi:hypothetical protein
MPSFLTPKDKLEGHEQAIWAERDRDLQAARQRRAVLRQQARQGALEGPPAEATT